MESYCALCFSVGFSRNSVESISAKNNKILKVKFGSANHKGRRHIGRPRKRRRDQFHFEDTRNRNQT